ncbi:ATP-binding protein [Actinacidiphila sp. DG2A-62]|uniref:ATP-binding protein n=1 Tax=Actinacidiphila sp. DG2A-62 TaxID=3108821 RepID=UPI002DB8D676|nr:ATP-binding protein [Actinacidiphila sp. DG2A-62]MEC3995353.1 ATP-binding protein [Actinacidiphila sp. DG2A-62]
MVTEVNEVQCLDVRAGAGGLPVYSRTLPREAGSAGVSRRVVTTVLTSWRLPPGFVDEARLVVDELVANASEHAEGASIRVTITRTGRGVRLAVTDMDHARPVLRTAGPGEEGGRGLFLVDEISDRWGVDPLPWGKRVWAELALAAE